MIGEVDSFNITEVDACYTVGENETTKTCTERKIKNTKGGTFPMETVR